MGITQVHPDYWRRWEEDIHWFHRMGGDEQLRNHYTFLILSFPSQEKQLPTMPMVISTKACSTMAFGKVLVCTRAPHPFSVGGHPSPQWKNQVLWCIWGLYIGIVTDSPPNSLKNQAAEMGHVLCCGSGTWRATCSPASLRTIWRLASAESRARLPVGFFCWIEMSSR